MNGEAELERKALALFETSLQWPPEDRTHRIEASAGPDDDLRDRALELLASLDAHNGRLMTGAPMHDLADLEWPAKIGAYRVCDLLGKGGMGAVFKAERDAGDFDHRVAIKVIRPGALSNDLIRRFEVERQILARLEHPNIARLYDGGTTERGEPFIVMEYIEGSPIAAWADESALSLEARLKLMLKVIDAVGYAHQNLVVHRDLTPGNVLVTADGTPKLIDFGIARPGETEIDKTGGETDRKRSLTPGFAAPECYEGSPVTTLSDIYSLGRLLERIVGETGKDPDIEAIIVKATAKDPQDRYPTARALAIDIDRFRTDRPVEARGGGRGYAFGKFLKRQKLAVASVSTILLLLAAGLMATTIGFQQARVARAEAEARLADTRDLANLMMFDVFDEASRVPGNTRMRAIVAGNAQRYLNELAADPAAPVTARLAAGEGFHRLASATGLLDAGNLGDILQGLALIERSADILEKVQSEAPSDATRLALSETLIDWSLVLGLSYIDPQQGIVHLRRARTLLLQIRSPSPQSVAARMRVQRSLGDLLACCTDDPAQGNSAIEQGIAYAEAQPAVVRNDPTVRRAYNDLVNLRAGFRIFFGSDDDGVGTFYDALEAQSALARETGAPEDLRLEATIGHNLARTLARLGRYEEAEAVVAPIHRRALADYAIDHDDNDLKRRIAMISLIRAWVAAERGASDRADGYLREGLRFARMAEWPEGLRSLPSLNYAHRLQEASEAAWALNRYAQACDLMRRSTGMYRAYARQSDLPVTALRYRLARMTDRLETCASNPTQSLR